MKVAVLGAGLVGTALAKLYAKEDIVDRIIVIDQNGNALNELDKKVDSPKLRTHRTKINKEQLLESVFSGVDVIVSALPSQFNRKITDLAVRLGINLIDLGAKDETLQFQYSFHEQARANNMWVIPGCGLAPGLVNIVAKHGFDEFDSVEDIKIYATALPVQPQPPFNYWQAFSVKGLIDEYANQTLLIQNGEKVYVDSLGGKELVTLDGLKEFGELEAFYMSGQITSLVNELEGKVKNLEFKAMRYPGHADIFRALFQMGFAEKRIIDVQTNLTYRQLIVRQLQKALPTETRDMVFFQVTISGIKAGKTCKMVYELKKDYDDEDDLSAIMYSTAMPAIIASMLVYEGKIDSPGGVYHPETILPKKEFIERLKEHNLSFTVREC